MTWMDFLLVLSLMQLSLMQLSNSQSIISTIAGTGSVGCTGDGGTAIYADLYSPTGIAVDTSGN